MRRSRLRNRRITPGAREIRSMMIRSNVHESFAAACSRSRRLLEQRRGDGGQAHPKRKANRRRLGLSTPTGIGSKNRLASAIDAASERSDLTPVGATITRTRTHSDLSAMRDRKLGHALRSPAAKNPRAKRLGSRRREIRPAGIAMFGARASLLVELSMLGKSSPRCASRLRSLVSHGICVQEGM